MSKKRKFKSFSSNKPLQRRIPKPTLRLLTGPETKRRVVTRSENFQKKRRINEKFLREINHPTINRKIVTRNQGGIIHGPGVLSDAARRDI